jgi:hypothetical protein
MRWRNPKEELPNEGETVWVLLQHWKEEGALSCEIYCGEVEYSNDRLSCRAFNNDWIGSGGASWTIWQSSEYEYQSDDCDTAKAWLPASELPLPKWIKK